MTIRITLVASFMISRRKADLDRASLAGIGIQNEVAPDGAYTLFYDKRALMRTVQISKCAASGKRKASSVVFDGELPASVFKSEPNQSATGAAVLADVGKEFLHNACN